MHKLSLILAYKSMLYTLRQEGEEISEKYLQLEEDLLREYDLDITDVSDNLEVFYQAITSK